MRGGGTCRWCAVRRSRIHTARGCSWHLRSARKGTVLATKAAKTQSKGSALPVADSLQLGPSAPVRQPHPLQRVCVAHRLPAVAAVVPPVEKSETRAADPAATCLGQHRRPIFRLVPGPVHCRPPGRRSERRLRLRQRFSRGLFQRDGGVNPPCRPAAGLPFRCLECQHG